eukprot:1161385-Pelagomonas_calceolata.AAC.2
MKFFRLGLCCCTARSVWKGSGLSDGKYVTLGAREVDDLECAVEHLRGTNKVGAVCGFSSVHSGVVYNVSGPWGACTAPYKTSHSNLFVQMAHDRVPMHAKGAQASRPFKLASRTSMHARGARAFRHEHYHYPSQCLSVKLEHLGGTNKACTVHPFMGMMQGKEMVRLGYKAPAVTHGHCCEADDVERLTALHATYGFASELQISVEHQTALHATYGFASEHQISVEHQMALHASKCFASEHQISVEHQTALHASKCFASEHQISVEH